MLEIKKLAVKNEEKEILKNISLRIRAGEIHAIMGPNGSGKSTLAHALMGNPNYRVSSGDILLDGKSIKNLSAAKRAGKGLFLAFQYPQAIPGVSVTSFLKAAMDSHRKAASLSPLCPMEFRKILRSKMEEVNLEPKFMNRRMNEGFSGGEKKKMEIVQMRLLNPKIAVLDEIDSGLDIDALKIVASEIRNFAMSKKSVLLITHYQRIFKYLEPDFVHVLVNGEIVETGGREIYKKLENKGYGKLALKN